MKIVFVSNYFNHHQKPLSNELVDICDSYYFIATQKMDEDRLSNGWKQDNIPEYVLDYNQEQNKCQRLIADADVVLYGSAPYSIIRKRINEGKLVLIYSERLFKKRITLKTFILFSLLWIRLLGKKNVNILCASAYTAGDFSRIHCCLGRYYKWGYFPETKHYDKIEALFEKKKKRSIIWVARMIEWKHPEMLVLLAERLRDAGYDFDCKMIGTGPLANEIGEMIKEKELGDYVHLLGSMKPESVREEMEKSEVFVFTSDRYEGWGAVLNEAMNSACAVVAASEIGSVPYLVSEYKNGLVFSNGNVDELFQKVVWLFENDEKRIELSKNAYTTIVEVWNSENAARGLVSMADCLIHNKANSIQEGPCSKVKMG